MNEKLCPSELVEAAATFGALRYLAQHDGASHYDVKAAGDRSHSEYHQKSGFQIGVFSLGPVRASGPDLLTLKWAKQVADKFYITDLGKEVVRQIGDDENSVAQMAMIRKSSFRVKQDPQPTVSPSPSPMPMPIPVSSTLTPLLATTPKSFKPDKCPACGQKRLGRGYSHLDGCPNTSIRTLEKKKYREQKALQNQQLVWMPNQGVTRIPDLTRLIGQIKCLPPDQKALVLAAVS